MVPGGLKKHIIDMMGKMLQVKKKLPLHAVVQEPSPVAEETTSMEEADGLLAALSQCRDGDEQIAVINRWKGNRDGGGSFQPRAPRGERRERSAPTPKTPERGPRKCPNCNGTHESRACPKLGIAVKDRLCFGCSSPDTAPHSALPNRHWKPLKINQLPRSEQR